MAHNGMSEGQEWIVETRDLVKVYGDGAQVRALDGVNMRVARGEFVSVMGPSGSGKSTLLNMIGALDQPTGGTVIVNGQDVRQIRDIDTFRARTVGFIFQMHNLIPTLTARENVEVPMRGQHIRASARRRRAEEGLELVGLAERMNHLPNQLSGGERQRVAIARSLANRPALVLADEPTGNLDSRMAGDIMDLLQQINDEGTTIIMVTHDSSLAERAGRTIRLLDGQVVDEEIRTGNESSPVAASEISR